MTELKRKVPLRNAPFPYFLNELKVILKVVPFFLIMSLVQALIVAVWVDTFSCCEMLEKSYIGLLKIIVFIAESFCFLCFHYQLANSKNGQER